MSPVIFGDVADDVVGQAVSFIHAGKTSLFQPAQAAAKRSDPKCAIPVLMEALDIIATQAIAFAKLPDGAVLQLAQATAQHAEPNGAVATFEHRAHVRFFQLAAEPG